jgi:hypothetical protein
VTTPEADNPGVSRWNRLRRTPLALLAAMVMALYLIGDQYPFSNYPMYANFGEQALVFFLSDGEGEPYAMKRVFNKSASDAKKIYKSYLEDACMAADLEENEATLEMKRAAGGKVLTQLLTEHKRKDFAEETSRSPVLQARLRRVWLDESDAFHDEVILLAEESLAP